MISRASYITSLAVALLLFTAVPAALAARVSLLDVRVGPHKRFDRIVFEFAAPTEARVAVKGSQTVEVRFADAEAPENFTLPVLPSGLALIKGLEAFRDGDGSLLFEITLARDATPSEMPLAGSPFRLAVDLAPRVTESERSEPKPDYIPGDLPIPTKFAEREPLLPDSLDPARVHAVLAYYYLSRGDTQRALSEAALYQQITGTVLDQIPQLPGVTPPAPEPTTAPKAPRGPWPQLHLPYVSLDNFGLIGVLAAVFLGGLLCGYFLRRLPRLSLRGFKLPRLHFNLKLKLKERTAAKLHKELEQGIDALDEAVRAEPPRPARPEVELPPSNAPERVPEPVLDAEHEMKETLMDRRVRRVLELSHDGRSVAAIAEELQMGQDEVKLILDLNQ